MDKSDALPDQYAPAGAEGFSAQVAAYLVLSTLAVRRMQLLYGAPKQRKAPNHGWQSRLVVHRPARRVVDLLGA